MDNEVSIIHMHILHNQDSYSFQAVRVVYVSTLSVRPDGFYMK